MVKPCAWAASSLSSCCSSRERARPERSWETRRYSRAVSVVEVMTSAYHPVGPCLFALAGAAALVVGEGVVQVAAGGGATASGEGAGPLPGADQVLEPVRRVVSGTLAEVAAGPALEPVEPQPGQPVPAAPRPAGRLARWPAGGAGVGDGPAVGPGEGDVPPGCRPGGEAGGQVAAGPGVQRARSGGLAGRIRQAEPRRGGHDQVHRAGQRSQAARPRAAGTSGTSGTSGAGRAGAALPVAGQPRAGRVPVRPGSAVRVAGA